MGNDNDYVLADLRKADEQALPGGGPRWVLCGGREVSCRSNEVAMVIAVAMATHFGETARVVSYKPTFAKPLPWLTVEPDGIARRWW